MRHWEGDLEREREREREEVRLCPTEGGGGGGLENETRLNSVGHLFMMVCGREGGKVETKGRYTHILSRRHGGRKERDDWEEVLERVEESHDSHHTLGHKCHVMGVKYHLR